MSAAEKAKEAYEALDAVFMDLTATAAAGSQPDLLIDAVQKIQALYRNSIPGAADRLLNAWIETR